MDREEFEKKAKDAIATAGDMAAKGIDWIRSHTESCRENRVDEPQHVVENRRIYGVTDLAPQSTGFRAFNAFRLMIAPLIIRIVWLIGAYIVYPIKTISILNDMSKSRYVSSGDMWKAFGISILALILFRLTLECLMAIFRIHESSTKMTELVGRLVDMEERRESKSQEGGGK